MIDQNKIYFFHNVYGDEQDLIEKLPDNVVAVPFGWTPEIEENRNNILSEIGQNASTIPCIFVYIHEHYADKSFFPTIESLSENDSRKSMQEHLVLAKWTQFDILSMPKPWTWIDILNKINSYHKL
jgi:hypothetical protein